MPLYEFQCTQCNSSFEELVRVSQAPAAAEVACPKCGSRRVLRKVSTFASKTSGGGSYSSASASSCSTGGT
jgi:putative FmdB family regulatory protein